MSQLSGPDEKTIAALVDALLGGKAPELALCGYHVPESTWDALRTAAERAAVSGRTVREEAILLIMSECAGAPQ